MRKHFCCRICRTAGLLAFLLLMLLGTAAAEQPPARTLRVAFPELSGVSETDEYGNRTGLLVDYLNEIAKYTDWDYEYIPVESEALIDDFLAGKFDLMGGAFYSPGFEEYFAYPDYSAGRSSAILLGRRDDDSLKSYDLNSLNGKTIGVYERATDKIRYLNDYLASNDLDCALHYYAYEDMEGGSDLYDKLRTGEVDLLLGNETELGGEFRMVASFQAQPYYIVVQPGERELLDELNMALAHILESIPTFASEAYRTNFPDIQMTDIQLNDEELAYIAAKGTLTVAVPHAWHPVFCVGGAEDQHHGVLIDLLDEISAFTGLTFEYVYADTYIETLQLVLDGQADLVGVYLGWAEEAFDQGLVLSRSYLSMSGIVLKHKSVNYPGQGLVCGVLNGRALPAQYEAAEIRSYDTAVELVQAVNDHEVDYVYGASSMLEQAMQTRRYVNVSQVSQAGDTVFAAFALARPAATELLTILNKAICNIPTEEKTAMLNRNLASVGYNALTLRDMIYDAPLVFALILACFLALVFAAVLQFQRNRMNRALMESRLQAAEAKSAAKSDFLSRMSHEIRTPMNAIMGLSDLACSEEDLPQPVADKLEKIRNSSRYLLALINDILDMSRIENGKLILEHINFSLPALMKELEEMMAVQAEQKGLHFETRCQSDYQWLLGDQVRLRQILVNLLSNAIKFTPIGGTVTLTVEQVSQDDVGVSYRFCVSDTGIGIQPEDLERIFLSFEQVKPTLSRSVGTGLGLPISRSIARLMGGDLMVESVPGQGSQFYMTLTFPLGAPQTQPEPDVALKSLAGVHILLVEDNDLNAEIAMELLAAQGIQARRAADGQAAVDAFTQSEPGEFQLILMDICMPEKDGYEATRDIRASGRPDADVPIVAMTANSFREDEAQALCAGMNAFVPKPVDVTHLLTVLRELL